MKNTVIASIQLMFLGLLMAGCTSTDGSGCPEALTGELTSMENEFVGNWVLTDMVSEEAVDITTDGVDNPSTDIFSQLPDCQKDVEYVFRNDRTYTVRQEYNAENCTNKLSFDGTWKYINGKLELVNPTICLSQTLNITVNNDTTVFALVDLVTFNDVSGLTVKSNVTLTYEKIL